MISYIIVDTIHTVKPAPATDDYTAYDRGDLSADIDRALGDLIERVVNRYMPDFLASDVRQQICGDLADIVIDYDKSGGSTSPRD